MIEDRINTDLKTAMLSGDKQLTNILRDLKSAILYEQVSQGSRGSAPSDELITNVFGKELKKRKDAIALYEKANATDKIDKEKFECGIISKYLPEQVSESAIKEAIQAYCKDNEVDFSAPKAIGQIIGGVKQSLGGNIDGALLAQLTKEFIQGKQQ